MKCPRACLHGSFGAARELASPQYTPPRRRLTRVLYRIRFVDKAYTTGEVTGEGDAKQLRMEIGLRHENLRACAAFTYRLLPNVV